MKNIIFNHFNFSPIITVLALIPGLIGFGAYPIIGLTITLIGLAVIFTQEYILFDPNTKTYRPGKIYCFFLYTGKSIDLTKCWLQLDLESIGKNISTGRVEFGTNYSLTTSLYLKDKKNKRKTFIETGKKKDLIELGNYLSQELDLNFKH